MRSTLLPVTLLTCAIPWESLNITPIWEGVKPFFANLQMCSSTSALVIFNHDGGLLLYGKADEDIPFLHTETHMFNTLWLTGMDKIQCNTCKKHSHAGSIPAAVHATHGGRLGGDWRTPGGREEAAAEEFPQTATAKEVEGEGYGWTCSAKERVGGLGRRSSIVGSTQYQRLYLPAWPNEILLTTW